MRIALIAGIILGLIYLVWVVVPDIYFERQFPTPQQRASKTPPTKGRYRITVVGAKLFPSNAKGGCWDPCWGKSKKLLADLSKQLLLTSGNQWHVVMGTQAAVLADQSSKQPDAFVEMKFGNQPLLRTHTVPNTLTPKWGTFHDVTLNSNDTFRVYVWDQDSVSHDLIGYYATPQIPKQYLEKGGLWKLRFQRVYEIKLAIKPLQNAPPKLLQPGRYRVTVLSAIVKNHKENGKSWDFFNGKPDPYAIVRLGPHQLQTLHKKNTLYPAWNHSRILQLNGTEKLRFYIYDKDLAQKDELMGSCNAGSLKKLKLRDGVLFRGSCGQIKEFNLKFDRIL